MPNSPNRSRSSVSSDRSEPSRRSWSWDERKTVYWLGTYTCDTEAVRCASISLASLRAISTGCTWELNARLNTPSTRPSILASRLRRTLIGAHTPGDEIPTPLGRGATGSVAARTILARRRSREARRARPQRAQDDGHEHHGERPRRGVGRVSGERPMHGDQ